MRRPGAAAFVTDASTNNNKKHMHDPHGRAGSSSHTPDRPGSWATAAPCATSCRPACGVRRGTHEPPRWSKTFSAPLPWRMHGRQSAERRGWARPPGRCTTPPPPSLPPPPKTFTHTRTGTWYRSYTITITRTHTQGRHTLLSHRHRPVTHLRQERIRAQTRAWLVTDMRLAERHALPHLLVVPAADAGKRTKNLQGWARRWWQRRCGACGRGRGVNVCRVFVGQSTTQPGNPARNHHQAPDRPRSPAPRSPPAARQCRWVPPSCASGSCRRALRRKHQRGDGFFFRRAV